MWQDITVENDLKNGGKETRCSNFSEETEFYTDKISR